MAWIDVLRWVHAIGATVLLGTGVGIAFFMLMANRTRDAALVAHTASIVVVADVVFTASAALLQPITGVLLAQLLGWNLTKGWLALSLALYVFTGLCWLPVVWIQIRIRDLAREAARTRAALPEAFDRLYRRWLWLGVPGFTAVLAILWLMVAKPSFG
jgi:uncharacterized membrane protein